MTSGAELTKAERLMRIRDLLQDAPLTSRQILDRLGGGRLRNVQRDLQQLEAQGLVDRENTRYRLVRQPVRPLGDVEALAVYSAARLLFHHSPEYHERYEVALEHLAARLPEHAQQVLARINAAYRKRRGDPATSSRTLEAAAQAWLGRHPLTCRYERPGKEPLQLQLLIYFIEINAQNKGAYAVGVNQRYPQGGVRVYKISRMKDAAFSTNGHYEVPHEFDPLKYLTNAWGIMVGPPVRVELLFDPEVKARVAEERFTCRVLTRKVLTTGHTLLELEVGGWLELVPWVLGWGGNVAVEHPPELREHIAREVTRAASKYTPA